MQVKCKNWTQLLTWLVTCVTRLSTIVPDLSYCSSCIAFRIGWPIIITLGPIIQSPTPASPMTGGRCNIIRWELIGTSYWFFRGMLRVFLAVKNIVLNYIYQIIIMFMCIQTYYRTFYLHLDFRFSEQLMLLIAQ